MLWFFFLAPAATTLKPHDNANIVIYQRMMVCGSGPSSLSTMANLQQHMMRTVHLTKPTWRPPHSATSIATHAMSACDAVDGIHPA